MSRRIPKALLLVALLAALVASSAPLFGGSLHADVTGRATDCFCLREGVISTSALCSVSILAVQGLAFDPLQARTSKGLRYTASRAEAEIFGEVIDHEQTEKTMGDRHCAAGTDFVCVIPCSAGAAQYVCKRLLAGLFERGEGLSR